MIRRFLASAICIGLSPLLIAQQSLARVNVDLRQNPGVRFLSPDLGSLAAIKTGVAVQIIAETNVTYGNATVLQVGVPTSGLVVGVKHASQFRHRDGQIFVRIAATVSGKPTEVVLRCSNPAERYLAGSSSSHPPDMRGVVRDLVLLGGLVLVIVLVAKGPIDG